MAFPSLKNYDHVVVSVSIDFPIKSIWDTPFYRISYVYSGADWDGLRDHLRDVPWEDIFKLSASPASEFFEWVHVGIDTYIFLIVSISFSVACAAAIVDENHFFFFFTNKINLLNLK